ncbi:hypothetical protein G7072_07905 [Nocardioides sp. HDW12B]|uniref:hypothetical protein n=1 Tax=Nocardioides sp. HDW12B TaxID=2714939 RepID=UPI00140C6104|nr:hypothetical protein [Nocardioides sp. HDW12B]QIK66282.1 hypothetical protein G7072_07905 [Nocardioides sp. HDW12B]
MLSDIAAVATAAGVLAAVVQLLLSRRQARAAFEHEFIRRFWAIGDDALQQPQTHSGTVERKRYLRLCEDEFEVMRLGSISWRTWEVWHEAIRDGAAVHRDYLDDYEWVGTCMGVEDHPGADCPAIFRSGTGVHSQHMSARWRSSVGRLWFTTASAARRTAYIRGGRFTTRAS